MTGRIRYKHLFDQMRVSNENYNGKWMSQKELHESENRWVQRCYKTGETQPDYKDWIAHQCEWCYWFAYFENDDDYGVCCNELSPNDGMVVFEHGGCRFHSFWRVV